MTSNEPNESLPVVPHSDASDEPEPLGLDAASKLTGMHPQMVIEFVRASLVVPSSTSRPAGDPDAESEPAAPAFDAAALYRLRQIEHLRTHHQAHLRTIRLVLGLLDRAEAAERELRHLRDRIH